MLAGLADSERFFYPVIQGEQINYQNK